MGKFQGLLGNGALCDYCLIGYTRLHATTGHENTLYNQVEKHCFDACVKAGLSHE